MPRFDRLCLAAVFVLVGAVGVMAETVTVESFVRAETDTYFRTIVNTGALGQIRHERQIVSVDDQKVIRSNRDTLYSSGVFDLTHPVTVMLPDLGDRFQSLLVVNEDHLVKLVTSVPGPVMLDAEAMGTRYVAALVRTMIDPNDPGDAEEAWAAQDALTVSQAQPGEFDVPSWDQEQLAEIRNALLTLAAHVSSAEGRFGDADQIDPIAHLIGTAAGWGGNPPEAAIYVAATPEGNDGTTPHTLTMKDVPVDAFWSVSVYNADGFFEPNPSGTYSLNDRTAVRQADGSVVVHFGGDPSAPNFIHTPPGWNYVVRLYQPRQELLDGTWTVPSAQPAIP